MTRSNTQGADDFWGRRKAAVAAEMEHESREAEQSELAETHAALEDKDDSAILAELDLPDPDTLEQGDDFSVFLAKAVPERIRRRALRKLWLSNPILANVDNLVDYGEDYTDSAVVIEGMQTAYQVGKGMLKHLEEMARQAEEAENKVSDDDDQALVENTPSLAEVVDCMSEEPQAEESVTSAQPIPTSSSVCMAVEPEPASVPNRRMRFSFDEGQTTNLKEKT